MQRNSPEGSTWRGGGPVVLRFVRASPCFMCGEYSQEQSAYLSGDFGWLDILIGVFVHWLGKYHFDLWSVQHALWIAPTASLSSPAEPAAAAVDEFNTQHTNGCRDVKNNFPGSVVVVETACQRCLQSILSIVSQAFKNSENLSLTIDMSRQECSGNKTLQKKHSGLLNCDFRL